jgi:hypothetical protein
VSKDALSADEKWVAERRARLVAAKEKLRAAASAL